MKFNIYLVLNNNQEFTTYLQSADTLKQKYERLCMPYIIITEQTGITKAIEDAMARIDNHLGKFLCSCFVRLFFLYSSKGRSWRISDIDAKNSCRTQDCVYAA